MIRQGSLLRVNGFDLSSDVRFTIVRYDHATDLYHLQSTRALHDSTIERPILHSWLRAKRLALVPHDKPSAKPSR